MKSEQEIKEELVKCSGQWIEDNSFFAGWYKALEWVLE